MKHVRDLRFFYRCVERAFLVTSFFFCRSTKKKKVTKENQINNRSSSIKKRV